MASKRPRVLLYCQHLLGVGHLTRSYAIVNSLVESFEVTFVQGGPCIGRRPDPRCELVLLPPLLMRESDASLYDPVGGLPPNEIFSRRLELMKQRLKDPFDLFIVELYPFGRRKMRGEIYALRSLLLAAQPRLKTLCSLRDIMVESKNQHEREARTVAEVKASFDHVLVHSDPRIVRLEETFAAASEIESRLVYTGFVTETTPPAPRAEREPQVLVSQGGGAVGDELVLACANMPARFPELFFRFVLGPHSPEALRHELSSRLKGAGNAEVLPFLQHFEAALSRSQLSISLGGYNTVMNLLHTRTPALVFPYTANREQELRATKLERMGLLTILRPSELSVTFLEQKIRAALALPYPAIEINLEGAENTGRFLKSITNS